MQSEDFDVLLAADPWRALEVGAAAMGVPLDAAQQLAFRRYTDLLVQANAQFNLTAVRDLPQMVARLHLDSLSLLPPVAAAAGLGVAELRAQSWRAVDVGSGAGVPGIPLLLAWPALQLCLIESVRKKAKFLTRVILLLEQVATVLNERAEVVGQDARHRQSYDLVMARAVAGLPALAELTVPLTREGGIVALAKGSGVSQELETALPAIATLGAEVLDLQSLVVPGIKEARSLVLLRKTRPTPPAYPRRPGLPTKRPLGLGEGSK